MHFLRCGGRSIDRPPQYFIQKTRLKRLAPALRGAVVEHLGGTPEVLELGIEQVNLQQVPRAEDVGIGLGDPGRRLTLGQGPGVATEGDGGDCQGSGYGGPPDQAEGTIVDRHGGDGPGLEVAPRYRTFLSRPL